MQGKDGFSNQNGRGKRAEHQETQCPVEYTNYAPAPRIGITKSSRLADSERALSCSLRSLDSRAAEGAVDLRRMRSERMPAACSAILSGLCGARRVARGAQSRGNRRECGVLCLHTVCSMRISCLSISISLSCGTGEIIHGSVVSSRDRCNRLLRSTGLYLPGTW